MATVAPAGAACPPHTCPRIKPSLHPLPALSLPLTSHPTPSPAQPLTPPLQCPRRRRRTWTWTSTGHCIAGSGPPTKPAALVPPYSSLVSLPPSLPPSLPLFSLQRLSAPAPVTHVLKCRLWVLPDGAGPAALAVACQGQGTVEDPGQLPPPQEVGPRFSLPSHTTPSPSPIPLPSLPKPSEGTERHRKPASLTALTRSRRQVTRLRFTLFR